MATVYRAIDRPSGQAYALKLLHARNARDPRAARRFAREAELARTLVAPNIVGVHGAVEFEGRAALLMELVEGPTLADRIALESPLARAQLVDLALDIARGLSVAHGGGVIHRDLKPANVLLAVLDDGREQAKIADFGMARAASFAGVDRESLTVLGTPSYMAPETIDPLAIDPRTDLYALGCIMVEMATGRPPFSAPTPFAVLEAHRKQAPPHLPEGYGEGLDDLVAALLAKQPSDRPHAASAVIDALEVLRGDDDPASQSRQLALIRPRGLLEASAAGRCAGCGAPTIRGLRVCLDCGLGRVRIEVGAWTVFVVGPGVVGDKFDSVRRDALLAWLGANADAGLEIGKFAKQIPRLPFPLVVGVSESSARGLAESLAQLGIHAEYRRGGRLSHHGMRQKMVRIGARRGKVALPLLIMFLPVMLLVLMLALPLLPLYFGVVAWWTSKPALEATQTSHEALPPQTEQGLREVERKAPLVSPRHRPGLGAVVRRVMALLEGVDKDERARLDAEMAHALTVAAVATERMSELDQFVNRPDFDTGEVEQRRNLRERDMWSARMLELTAALDALVARQAAARGPQRTKAALALRGGDHAQLEQLRHSVEALEEVKSL